MSYSGNTNPPTSNVPVNGAAIWTAGNITTAAPIGSAGMTAPTTGQITSIHGTGILNGTLTIATPPMQAVREADKTILRLEGDNPVIQTTAGEIDLILLTAMCKELAAIMCMMRTHMESLDEYPALRDAFDRFKVVETLVRSDKTDGE